MASGIKHIVNLNIKVTSQINIVVDLFKIGLWKTSLSKEKKMFYFCKRHNCQSERKANKSISIMQVKFTN